MTLDVRIAPVLVLSLLLVSIPAGFSFPGIIRHTFLMRFFSASVSSIFLPFERYKLGKLTIATAVSAHVADQIVQLVLVARLPTSISAHLADHVLPTVLATVASRLSCT